MNRGTRDLLFIVAGLLLSAVTLWAAGAGYDVRLTRDVQYLNAIGSKPVEAKTLERSLASTFRTGSARLAQLRKDRLGTGDIAAAFAVASRLAGGISEANLGRIVSLWRVQHSAGWAGIARSLGVRLRAVVLKVESIGEQHPRTAASASGSAVVVGPHDTLRGLLHHG